MPASLPLATEIDQASSGSTQFRVLINRYGNGYEQRAADGLNNNLATWEVSWEGLTLTSFNTIVSAIETAKGVDYFTWTAPGDASSKKWVIETYSRKNTSGGIYGVSATLRQVADLG